MVIQLINILIIEEQDFRNYKVTTEQASTKLGFKSQYDVKDIVHHLYNNPYSVVNMEN